MCALVQPAIQPIFGSDQLAFFCVPLFARHSMRSSLVLPSGTDDLFMFHSPQSFSTSDFYVSPFGPLAVSLTYLF